MKKILIVGYGFLGKAMGDFFKGHYDIFTYDPYLATNNGLDSVTVLDNKKASATNFYLAIVCVPTPMHGDGSVDISLVDEAVALVNSEYILIKSTIPPGTTAMLANKYGKRIVFSPEYIGESTYVTPWWKDIGYMDPHDIKKHDFFIFGGKESETSEVLQTFKKVMGPIPKYIQTDSKTAELTKYMVNSWGSTKVMFCNEFARIAETMGVDYDELRELWLLDGRVNRMHTAVFKDKRGFGGKCFPKDINGIVKASEEAGYLPKLLQEVINSNTRIQDEVIPSILKKT